MSNATAKLPANQVTVTAIGRMGMDPKAVSERLAVASLAVGQRVKSKEDGSWGDGPVMWYELRSVAGALADARKGDLVKVVGRQDMTSYVSGEGDERTTRTKYGIWIESLEVLSNPKPKQSSDLDFPTD